MSEGRHRVRYWLWLLAAMLLLFMPLLMRWRYRVFVARVLGLPPPYFRVRVKRGLNIATPEGVTLAADHYAPVKKGRYPTVLIRSPYGRHRRESAFGLLTTFYAYRFAERGYHVIVQDVRGRFESSGEFSPVFHEKADGLATIAWIKQQAWFDGQLGLWGGSYLGLVQWAIAPSDPSIGAMVPSITGSSLRDVVYPDGALDLGLALRWMILLDLLQRSAGRPTLFSVRMLQKAERMASKGFLWLPVGEVDHQVLAKQVAFFQEWLTFEDETAEHWQMLREEVDVTRVEAPVHLVGGWYDFFLRTLLMDYTRLRDAGREAYLTIGPWHHFSTIASMPDLGLGIDWFEAQLKDNATRLREKPVRVYVMGAQVWREFEEWPPPAGVKAFHLQAGGGLSELATADSTGYSTFRYDPADPTPALGGAQFGLGGGPRDNRKHEARPDVLVFTSETLKRDVEVIGPVVLRLYVQSSLDYTDFFGRLCDVHPNGKSINLCDGLFRISPGRGVDCGNGTRLIEVNLWATAHRFKAGHAIRVQVASGAHPRWMRNLGTGEPLRTAMTMRVAEQRVFHDAAHPSAILLPVMAD